VTASRLALLVALAGAFAAPGLGVVVADPPRVPAPTVPAVDITAPTPAGDAGIWIRAIDHVPDNPAIDLLGAEDLKVSKPGSVKDLDVELRSLYKDGKVVPEIAIELSPWALTVGRSSSYRDYLASRATRLLRRFTISLATTSQGDGDAQTTLGAVGVRLRLIDDADWRLNGKLVDCALDALTLPAPPANHDGDDVLTAGPAPDADATKAVERCITTHAKPWNSTQLAVGAALSSALPHGKLRWDLHDLAAWAAFAHTAGKASGVTVGVKYLYSDARTIDTTTQSARHTFATTASFETRRDKFGLLGTIGVGGRWTRADMATSTTQAVGLVGGEVQFQVFPDTWLAVRFSAELANGGSDLISLANLKWNYDITPTRSR